MRPPARRPAALFAAALSLPLVLASLALPVGAQAVLWVAAHDSGVMHPSGCPGGCPVQMGSLPSRSVAVDAAGNTYVTGTTEAGAGLDFRTIKYDSSGVILWSVASALSATTDDVAAAVAVDANGDAYVTGGSCDLASCAFLTLKLAGGDGHLLWSASHPVIGNSWQTSAVGLALDGAGNPHVTGTAHTGSGWEYRTIKYAAADGSVLWTSGQTAPAGGRAVARALALDAAGNAFVTGSWESSPSWFYRWHTVKLSAADGAALWSADQGDSSYSQPSAIAVDADGNPHVAGWSDGGALVAKYAAGDGQVLWDVAAPSQVLLWNAIAVDAAGDVQVAGVSATSWHVARHASADGALLWSAELQPPVDGYAVVTDLGLDAAGDVYVTGSAGGNVHSEMRTARFSGQDGTLAWVATYNGAGDDYCEVSAVAVDGSGNVTVAGWALTGSRFGFRTLRYNSATGAQVFASDEGKLVVPAADSGRAVATDAAGNVYVAGDVRGSSGHDRDFRTLKYAPDGTLLWVATWDGPAHRDDAVVALALDGLGNVYVAGHSETAAGREYRTIKYSGGDGSLTWSASYPVTSPDAPWALAVDAGGNAYVAGTSNDKALTIKYAAADGAVLWAASYPAGADSHGAAYGLALDALGNAYVTGYSDESGQTQLRTLKYSSTSGGLLWGVGLPGTPGYSGHGRAITVDTSGSVYVAAYRGGAGGSDYWVVRYSGATGAVLWSRTYDGPAGGDDVPRDVETDAIGYIYVTGYAATVGGSQGLMTLRLGNSAGDVVWRATQGGGPDVAWASDLELDGAGNPVVAGLARNGSNWDALVTKLARGDGHALWSARFDGGLNDRGSALAIRPQSVYLAGTSATAASGDDILTVKYLDDGLAPGAPTAVASTTHQLRTWSTVGTVGMRWSGAADPAPSAGLAGYSVRFDLWPATLPDETVEVPHSADPHELTSAAPDGQGVYFHVRSCDKGGNCSPAAHAGPYWIDSTPPTPPTTVSSSSHVPGVPSNETTLVLSWTPAVDPTSGLDGYGWAVDDVAGSPCPRIQLAEEGTVAAAVELSLGTWYAHVCARDNAGNWSGVTTAGPYLIGDPADLSVTLTDDLDPIHVRGAVTYTATYANAGPSAAPNATLDLTLPVGLEFVSSVPGEPECSGDGQTVKCALGNLSTATGGTLTVTAQALPRTKGLQSVSAKVRAEASDTDLSDNTAVQTTLVKFVKGDLQDDWATDLFLRNVTTGENVAWLMNGTTRLSEAVIAPAAPQSVTQQVSGVDDFDGDGRNDLAFWDSATGAVEFWLMDGATRPGDPVPLTGGSQAPPWRLAATADFDRDGWPDLLWRNESTQKLVVWTLNGTAKAGEIVPSPDQAVHANWQVVGAVDLNGDGTVDLLWYNVSTGKIVYWWMDGSVQRITGSFTNPPNAGDANWKVLATGDYGAGPGGIEGTADVVWRNETSGRYVVWHLDLAGNRTAGTFTTPDAPASPLDWTIAGPR